MFSWYLWSGGVLVSVRCMNLSPYAGRIAPHGWASPLRLRGCQPQSGAPAANRAIVAETDAVAGSQVEHAE